MATLAELIAERDRRAGAAAPAGGAMAALLAERARRTGGQSPPAMQTGRGPLVSQGPGPTGYIDPALYEMGAIGRRFEPEIGQGTGGQRRSPPDMGGVTPFSNAVGQFGAGSQSGIARTLGMPVDGVTGAINALGGATGMWGPIENPVLGSQNIDEMLQPFRANVRDPQTTSDRMLRRVGEEVGASAAMAPVALATPLASAFPGAFVATEGASSIGAGLGAGVASEMFPDSVAAEIVGSLLGGIPAGYAVGRQFDTTPINQLRAADSSGDDLISQAGDLYRQAEAQGITATQQQTQGLAQDVRTLAATEGLISPTGRIAESYPRVRDAISMVDDFAQGQMTPTQMQAVRRTFQGVAGSPDGAERRVGVALLRQFDDFVEPLAPEFRQANALYRRAMLGNTTDVARELAEARAPQFSGSGFENALRTEYRALDRNIIKNRLRGLTDDQTNAIQRVARGGPVENVMRGLGRAAPTGVVSAGIGAGVPFLVGNALGGPALGAGLGAATMAIGAGARTAATRMGRTNAEIAELIMRSADGAMPQMSGPEMSRVAAILLGLRSSTVEADQ